MEQAPSKLKYIYFDVYARGEPIRILLNHAKVTFEDERLSFEDFGPRKAAGEFEMGQLPVLLIDGVPHTQT